MTLKLVWPSSNDRRWVISFTVQRVQGHSRGREEQRGSWALMFPLPDIGCQTFSLDHGQPFLLCAWKYPKLWIMLWFLKCTGLNLLEVRDHVKLTGMGSPKLVYTYNTVNRWIDSQDLTPIKLARAKCQDPLCSDGIQGDPSLRVRAVTCNHSKGDVSPVPAICLYGESTWDAVIPSHTVSWWLVFRQSICRLSFTEEHIMGKEEKFRWGQLKTSPFAILTYLQNTHFKNHGVFGNFLEH